MLLLVCSAGCKETVLHGIDESRANQLSILLDQIGIASSKHASGPNWDLRVARSDLGPALRAIENSRMLTRGENRHKPQESSFIPSDNQQLQAAERQLSWSIEETLERIPGVVEAKVHLWLNKPTQFGLSAQDNSARSASALLLTEPTAALNLVELKLLLAGATGAPQNAISIVTYPINVRIDATQSTSASNTGRTEGQTNRIDLRTLSYWTMALMPIALVLFWGLRRLRRRRYPKLSPAQIRRTGQHPTSSFNGAGDVGLQ